LDRARARFAEAFKRGVDTSPGEFTCYTIAVILLVVWLLGFLGLYTIGSVVHVLLVAAIVLFLVGLFRGRRILG
jgi:uncharacterized protein DUF5670